MQATVNTVTIHRQLSTNKKYRSRDMLLRQSLAPKPISSCFLLTKSNNCRDTNITLTKA